MGTGVDDSKKGSYKLFLICLVPVDLVLLIAGTALFLHIFWTSLFSGETPGFLLPIVSWFPFLALIFLIVHHIFSWIKTFRS